MIFFHEVMLDNPLHIQTHFENDQKSNSEFHEFDYSLLPPHFDSSPISLPRRLGNKPRRLNVSHPNLWKNQSTKTTT
jgi:hypothetical protein